VHPLLRFDRYTALRYAAAFAAGIGSGLLVLLFAARLGR